MTTTPENVITVTEKAAAKVKSLRDGSEETKGKPLRVYVEAGGCSGFQYGMSFDTKGAEDLLVSAGDIEVVVDPVSVGYLRGATIDFEDGLQGTGFKIINPNAQRSCGCGKSFESCG